MHQYIYTTLAFFVLTFLLIVPAQVHATTLHDTNYQFEVGNIRILPETDDPTPQPTISETKETVASIPDPKPQKPQPFGFRISNALIDYGTLSATNPVIRKSILSISKGSAIGYTITAFADHPLESEAQMTIPDTTCDSGTCSQTTAALWTNLLTYGFGYRCDNSIGYDCVHDFSLADYYKQLSDADKNESPVVIAQSNDSAKDPQMQISYKVVIPGTQQPGAYTNTVTFLAIPTF